MRFLADESCDFGLVRALREAGYEVTAVAEISPRAEDSEIINLAVREERILLTEDKDFGQLVYAHGQDTGGIVFLRYPPGGRRVLFQEVVRLVRLHGKKLAGCFVVVQPGRVRITRAPKG